MQPEKNKSASTSIILPMVLALLLFPKPLPSQNPDTFRVLFWNVENLFDCRHDTLKHDTDFLPTSLRAWHYGRYKKKLTDISRVITAIGGFTPPALVGLCEVENDTVMRDLTRRSPLKEHGYRYVMTQSSDERGIDVALLYQPSAFKLINAQSVKIPPDRKNRRPTRDILHVSGRLLTGDTLDIFVCHLPSRLGGQKDTEPYRLSAARTLKNAVDSLYATRHHPQIILMGDFNDYPRNVSIKKILGADALPPHPQNDKLYHLLARKALRRDYGTHKYKGEWGLLDHLIVSGTLANPTAPFHTQKDPAHIARLPFLLQPDDTYGGTQPFRTYHGMKYQEGFSDHLPIYADFLYTFVPE